MNHKVHIENIEEQKNNFSPMFNFCRNSMFTSWLLFLINNPMWSMCPMWFKKNRTACFLA